MSKAIDTLTDAMKAAEATRPRVGVFPTWPKFCASRSDTQIWSLPSCHSLFLTQSGPVVMQGEPLGTGAVDVPAFDEEGLVRALRIDQAGEGTSPEFLEPFWRAGVVRYNVDLEARKVAYQGCNGEEYTEAYSAVEVQ